MINHNELEYLIALGDVLENGEHRADRTGVGTRALFGLRMEFDLTTSFPLLTREHILLSNYEPLPAIKAEVAV